MMQRSAHRAQPENGPNRRGPALSLVDGVDAAAGLLVAVLSVVAVLGYHEIFRHWGFLVPAGVGASGALAIGLVGRVMGRRTGAVVLGSLLALAVVGMVTTQGVPTPTAATTFADGLIGGWAEVLSTLPPMPMTSDLVVLPFVSTWLGTLLGVELLRRQRLTGLPGIGPVLVLVLTILMTFESRIFALAQGAAMMAGVLVIAYLQQRRALLPAEPSSAETVGGAQRVGGIAKALAVTAVIAAVAPMLAPHLPLTGANDRFDLRDHQTPPFDPLREPTPLVQMKAALQEKNAERIVFTVTATEPIDRFPVAVLDHYTNEFWSVVADTSDAPARFLPVGSGFPAPANATVDGWQRLTASIEIKELDRLSGGDFDQPWLPGIGWPISISSPTAIDLRFNPDTGTVAVAPDGPPTGTVYTIEAFVPPAVEDVALAEATTTTVEPFDLAVPQLQAFADDTLEGTNGGWDAVAAIRTRLVDGGAYDSRETSPTARSGHSLGRLAEFVSGGGQTVGFEEQYAATAALIARHAGLPARVVVGFVVTDEELDARWADGSLDVRADDIAAWLEVRFDGVGWLPFDVTPPRDRQPEDRPTGRTQRRVAEPNPPPTVPPPVPPPRLQESDPSKELDEDDEPANDGQAIPWTAVAVGGAVMSPLLLVTSGAGLILGLKRRRTRRRRGESDPSIRTAGAWYEVVDRFRELGLAPPTSATPGEFVRGAIAEGHVTPETGVTLLDLVSDAEVAAYHPDPVDADLAARAWDRSDAVAGALRSGLRGTARWKARLDPAPLLGRDPLAQADARHDEQEVRV